MGCGVAFALDRDGGGGLFELLHLIRGKRDVYAAQVLLRRDSLVVPEMGTIQGCFAKFQITSTSDWFALRFLR